MNPPILLVDDDPNDVFFMTEAFRRAEITNFHVAVDGRQAIDYLCGEGAYSDRERYPMPAIVLLDLKLPFIMGLEVLRRARQSKSGPVIIILSASSDPTDIATAYDAGANAYLVKPSSMDRLQEMVNALKTFWLTHNTLPERPSTA